MSPTRGFPFCYRTCTRGLRTIAIVMSPNGLDQPDYLLYLKESDVLKEGHNCLPTAMSCQSGPERLRLSPSHATRMTLASNAEIVREARLGIRKGP